ncbi:hypothetical protein RSK20926_18912 [Roseobacter sp. SK209-2-6]|uniref:GNAT family N-acetyltransferase n=1 Tax=Roseobacter sp. SK209-2-6 TaxID=388739 RepID=UPI0000F3F634|nr:GNAT family N-acyltransferase [Roseobacter sp. SK209-2-6]EBA17839.1 hypothetical protein RSK20926_18912 [Roseobacter sp. SK209-2-6]
MVEKQPDFQVSLATTKEEVRAAQSLRYEVFVEEMGASGPLVDHKKKLEKDHFDPFCDHLLVQEVSTGRLAGVYRLMRGDQAEAAGGFYSDSEYDHSALKASERRLLELGRSCLDADFRGGPALFHLWNGLADYVKQHEIEILFGVASFPGVNLAELAEPLTLLQREYSAPQDLISRSKTYQSMELMGDAQPDRKRAMLSMPALIKAYLRLGGAVGDGAFVDREFNTTDVCLILDTSKMNTRQRRMYVGQKQVAQCP